MKKILQRDVLKLEISAFLGCADDFLLLFYFLDSVVKDENNLIYVFDQQ